ncbi:MAG: aconitase X [Aestuariivirgaceae bacterium]
MKTPELDQQERDWRAGKDGPAMQLAINTVLQAASIAGAERLIPATFAHIDACFYAGQAHIDFARLLLAHNTRFAIPAWTNNGLVSLEQPDLRAEAGDRETIEGARELMKLYIALGARPVWTCAPYQLPDRPALGDHIIVGESNAVSFYNSVIGARSNKYGDFLDVACALTGKVPLARLHTDAGRAGEIVLRTGEIPDALKAEEVFYHLLGHVTGQHAGSQIPVIEGLPGDIGEDKLKAVSAAVAASGGVELWHGVGVTPEAPSLEAALQGRKPAQIIDVTIADLAGARGQLSSGSDGPLNMVALGTPHFSITEFAALAPLLAGRKVHQDVKVYIATSRFVRDLAQAQGHLQPLVEAGAEIITDTCTYFSPKVRGCTGRAMTNAAKWAYYAPGMLGIEVCFGSLKECAESAVRGKVWRDNGLWQPLS